jgi:hypothetical protein
MYKYTDKDSKRERERKREREATKEGERARRDKAKRTSERGHNPDQHQKHKDPTTNPKYRTEVRPPFPGWCPGTGPNTHAHTHTHTYTLFFLRRNHDTPAA